MTRQDVAIVTGSGRGLGAAIALGLARRGAAVIINYRENAQAAQSTLARVQQDGGHGILVQADVTDESQVSRLFDEAETAFGPVTIVVNNALVSFAFNPVSRPSYENLSWQDFTDQWHGAVKAAYLTAQRGLKGMKEAHYGRIVNIVSDLIFQPTVPYHSYITAKSALLGLTRTLAVELGPFNITVNAVAPGLIYPTEASRPTPEWVREELAARTPLGRVVTPEDVVGPVLFLASEDAGMVTGQCLVVDGGLMMR
ncbi:MAG: SDR family oxidoreductase [Firmicutes bacterium]|nr:SDR family oxidoreductase [Bacillota bacterium]